MSDDRPNPGDPDHAAEPDHESLTLHLSARQARLLDLLLILGTVALAIIVIGMLGGIFFSFGDIVLDFFLAWLIAFILSPLVRGVARVVPGVGRAAAAVIVYLVLIAAVVGLTVFIAQTLASSITDFVAQVPTYTQNLPSILQPVQGWLDQVGFSQVHIADLAQQALTTIQQSANQLLAPLQQIAVASLGVIGTLLIVVILSVYIVIDQERLKSFLNRIVPPARRDEVALLERSVSRSFGGFLRGQAAIGLTYAMIALGCGALLGLDFIAVTTAVSGILMAIPFFGPFVAWSPPVIVAVFTSPGLIIPTILIMGVGWFVVMNVLQPRLMAEAVGLHPIVVLGSVLIGSKIAGVAGAIFGIPVAAVIASFFFHYLEIFGGDHRVAARAARRLQDREGRPVRIPREPMPGVDADVDEVARV